MDYPEPPSYASRGHRSISFRLGGSARYINNGDSLKTCCQPTPPPSREDGGGAGFPGFDRPLSSDFDRRFALAVSRALESEELAQLLDAQLEAFDATGSKAQGPIY